MSNFVVGREVRAFEPSIPPVASEGGSFFANVPHVQVEGEAAANTLTEALRVPLAALANNSIVAWVGTFLAFIPGQNCAVAAGYFMVCVQRLDDGTLRHTNENAVLFSETSTVVDEVECEPTLDGTDLVFNVENESPTLIARYVLSLSRKDLQLSYPVAIVVPP